MNEIRRKRAKARKRIVETACCIALGILLYWGWHVFNAFEGPAAAVGPLPHDHPMHRVVEAAVFFAVAAVPVIVYFILRLTTRRRR